MTTTQEHWQPAIGDYVETADGMIGVIHRIDTERVVPRYTVVDCDGIAVHTNGVALLEARR